MSLTPHDVGVLSPFHQARFATMDKNHVTIDLLQLSEIAHIGVRRAVLFMGIGLNAAHRDDFIDYQLHTLLATSDQTSPLIDFFPSDLPLEKVREFKREFAMWITACGLREVLEHYALFLDRIHNYSLQVYQAKKKLGKLDPVREQKRFNETFGIPRKLHVLRERFSIAPNDSESIAQMYRARNCLTHDFGVVRSKHCTNGIKFVLTWNAFDLIMIGNDTGREQAYGEFMEKKTQENSTIAMKKLVRERIYSVGEKIKLSQQDLAEICHSFASAAIPSAVQSFVEFLETNGVPVDGKDTVVPRP